MRVCGELKKKVCAILSDPESIQIIEAVLDKPKSETTLRRELNIPQSSLYRKLSCLRETGLLMVESYSIRPDGRREASYSCAFREVRFRVEGKQLFLDLTESQRGKERRWFELFYGVSSSSAGMFSTPSESPE